MRLFENLKRKIIFIVCITLAVLQLSSCAAQIVDDEGIAAPLIPDVLASAEQTIENNNYSEDIVIEIQRPDIMGDDDQGEDNNSSSTDDEYNGEDTENEDEITDIPDSPDKPNGDEALAPDLGDKENPEEIELYDVPLPAHKQKYVLEMAEEFKIPPELIFGVMYVETRYKENINSANGKYLGIMQIAKSNLKTLNKKFGITDLTDYLQNVKAGAYFLSYFYKKYDGDINKVLMCYHRGEGGASVKWREGVTEDSYCVKVKKEMARIMAARQ